MELAHEHFAELSAAVQRCIAQEKISQYRQEWLWFGARALLFATGLTLCSFPVVILKIIGFFITSYAFYSIAITGMHESRHDALSSSHTVNRFWGYIFGDFWSGESNVWWYDHHVRDHHVYTNIKNHDEPYFSVPWVNNYVYFWVLPFFAVPFLFGMSMKYLWGKWRELTLYLVLFIAGYAFQTFLFSLVFPLSQAIILTLVARSLFTPIFLHLALFNHIALPSFEKRPAWLPHQVVTTRNVAYHWFLAGLGGNAFVHRHIEHHLFPSLPNNILEKISPLVQETCKKYGYVYIEQSYQACLSYCLKHYQTLLSQTHAVGNEVPGNQG